MKKYAAMCVALAFALGAKAQIPEGLHVVALRMGDVTSLGPYTNVAVPTSLAYEYCFAENAFDVPSLCLGVGGVLGHASVSTLTTTVVDGSGRTDTRTETNRWFFGGLKGYAHYDVLSLVGVDAPQIDTYASLTLGTRFKKWTWKGENAPSASETISSESTVWRRSPMMGLQVGARYFIIPNVGVSLEVGYDGMSILDFGLVASF
mgnify:CR=1 FL=1